MPNNEAPTTLVLRVLHQAAGPLGPNEITRVGGLSHREVTRTALRDLQDAGLVRRLRRGQYELAKLSAKD